MQTRLSKYHAKNRWYITTDHVVVKLMRNVNYLSKITLLFLLLTFYDTSYAQTSHEFPSATEAIAWAQVTANKTIAAQITDIVITNNNDAADLLKLKTLNDNSENGLFRSLESIELSGQIASLPDNCFYTSYHGAQWLKTFSAPKLAGVGNWAFRFCTNLSSISLPSVQNIGTCAFYNCNISTILLPTSLVNMDINSFLGCINLTSITIDANNQYFSVEDGVLYNAEKTVLISYPSGKMAASFIAPNSVTIIERGAFGICNNLSEIKLPSVTTINDWASEYCTNLKTVRFAASQAISFGSNVFSGVPTTNIDVYLNETGVEFANNVNGNTWKEYEWKSVNKETPSKTRHIENLSVSVYPHSVQDMLYIESNEAITGIAIYDLNSKIVLQTPYSSEGISLRSLPTGVYIVKVNTESGIKNERVLKTN